MFVLSAIAVTKTTITRKLTARSFRKITDRRKKAPPKFMIWFTEKRENNYFYDKFTVEWIATFFPLNCSSSLSDLHSTSFTILWK